MAPGGRWVTGELDRVLTALRFWGTWLRTRPLLRREAGPTRDGGQWDGGGGSGQRGRHSVRNATSLQVRFRNGEVFDHVQLLGVDSRREVAAIRMANPAGLPWSVSNGVVSGARVADEVPGAGRGYRLIQYTAPSSPGSSGGVLFDRKGAALALGGRAFSVPEWELRGSARRRAGDGRGRIPQEGHEPKGLVSTGPQASLGSSERSDPLSLANDSTMILPSFGYDRLRPAALGRHRDFRAFHLRMVDLVQVRGGFTLFSVTRTRA